MILGIWNRRDPLLSHRNKDVYQFLIINLILIIINCYQQRKRFRCSHGLKIAAILGNLHFFLFLSIVSFGFGVSEKKLFFPLKYSKIMLMFVLSSCTMIHIFFFICRNIFFSCQREVYLKGT